MTFLLRATTTAAAKKKRQLHYYTSTYPGYPVCEIGRYPDEPVVVLQTLVQVLPNPPLGVCAEPESPRGVELLHRVNQPHGGLLQQIHPCELGAVSGASAAATRGHAAPVGRHNRLHQAQVELHCYWVMGGGSMTNNVMIDNRPTLKPQTILLCWHFCLRSMQGGSAGCVRRIPDGTKKEKYIYPCRTNPTRHSCFPHSTRD